MSSNSYCCPATAFVVSGLLLLLGSGFCLTSLFDPNWLVSTFADKNLEHHHGLYLWCQVHYPGRTSSRVRIQGNWDCFRMTTRSRTDYFQGADQVSHLDYLTDWNVTMLSLLAFASTLSLLAALFAFISGGMICSGGAKGGRCPSVTGILCGAISCVLMLSAVIYCNWIMHDPRFKTEVLNGLRTALVRKGHCYDWAIIGCVINIFGTIAMAIGLGTRCCISSNARGDVYPPPISFYSRPQRYPLHQASHNDFQKKVSQTLYTPRPSSVNDYIPNTSV